MNYITPLCSNYWFEGGDATGQQTGKPKNSFGNLSFPRPNLSLWFQKLIKSFKNLSNYFAFDEKEEDDDEVEVEMEIGLPTEVQHVTHIGLDGLGGGTGSEKSLDRAPELLSFPSFPLKQFEQALAAQTRAPPPPVDGSWLH